jgi:hypothetical protein
VEKKIVSTGLCNFPPFAEPVAGPVHGGEESLDQSMPPRLACSWSYGDNKRSERGKGASSRYTAARANSQKWRDRVSRMTVRVCDSKLKQQRAFLTAVRGPIAGMSKSLASLALITQVRGLSWMLRCICVSKKQKRKRIWGGKRKFFPRTSRTSHFSRI